MTMNRHNEYRSSVAGWFSLTLAAMFLLVQPVLASEVTKGNSYGVHSSEKPDWFKESFLEFEEDVAEATSANRRVMRGMFNSILVPTRC